MRLGDVNQNAANETNENTMNACVLVGMFRGKFFGCEWIPGRGVVALNVGVIIAANSGNPTCQARCFFFRIFSERKKSSWSLGERKSGTD